MSLLLHPRARARTPIAQIVCSVSTFIGFLSSYYLQEKWYQKNVVKKGPEARLYLSLIGGILFPIGAFILAFSQGRGHWFGPVVGMFLVSSLLSPLPRLGTDADHLVSPPSQIFYGVYTIYLAVFTYLADVYTIVSLLSVVTLVPESLTRCRL